jgi:hypothetical protein
MFSGLIMCNECVCFGLGTVADAKCINSIKGALTETSDEQRADCVG